MDDPFIDSRPSSLLVRTPRESPPRSEDAGNAGDAGIPPGTQPQREFSAFYQETPSAIFRQRSTAMEDIPCQLLLPDGRFGLSFPFQRNKWASADTRRSMGPFQNGTQSEQQTQDADDAHRSVVLVATSGGPDSLRLESFQLATAVFLALVVLLPTLVPGLVSPSLMWSKRTYSHHIHLMCVLALICLCCLPAIAWCFPRVRVIVLRIFASGIVTVAMILATPCALSSYFDLVGVVFLIGARLCCRNVLRIIDSQFVIW